MYYLYISLHVPLVDFDNQSIIPGKPIKTSSVFQKHSEVLQTVFTSLKVFLKNINLKNV